VRARLLSTIVLCGCFIAGSAATPLFGAPVSQEHIERLQKLRNRIQSLQQQLLETREQRDDTRRQLQQAEERIGALLKGLRVLNYQLQNDHRGLSKLRQQKQNEKQVLKQNARLLRKQARSAYILGRQETLKLLLNQQQPNRVQRILIYYRYLNRARTDEIDSITTRLRQITDLQFRIQQHQQKVRQRHQTQLTQKQMLEKVHSKRQQLLASLNTRVRSQTDEIGRLQRDEKRLQQLVSGIRVISKETPIPTILGARFSEQRGKLKLPMGGRILGRYGAPKYLGKLRWRGLFIAGKSGTAVKSVFRGRVAYADWLPGFGLLMILDHGDGYMTLYGHNQSLYKEVGDWVEAGQTITSSGNTGNPPRAGLYFEVRHQGRTQDPLRWCRLR
jgi:murein hydrolase activator